MKRQVRRGVFETNSSSTHSLTMCSENEFESWKNGEVLFDRYKDEFVTAKPLSDSEKEEAKSDYEDRKETFWKSWDSLTDEEKDKWYSKYAQENDLRDEDCQTYEEWEDDSYLETFVDTYTTKSGERVVAFGKYGYDG